MIKKYIFNSLRVFLIMLVKLNLTNMISFFLISHIKKYNKKNNTDRPSILIFEKPRFINDVVQIDKYSDFNPIVLKMKISVILGKIFLPTEIRGQHKYHKFTSEINNSKKNKYRLFLSKILPLLFKELNIKAIVTGNMDYWEHQEWSWAAKDLGVPTVVLYRESVGWKDRNIKLQNHYSTLDYQLPISKLAVFGPETKTWIVNTGLVKKENIIVTGAPRTDAYHEYSKTLSFKDTKNLVVLFDFISEKYSSSTTPLEVLEMFINISNKVNNYKFLIKTKEDIYKKVLIKKIETLRLPTDNIIIESNVDFKDVLRYSKLIIGYMRSTAMLESMLAKCALILPVWGDLTDEDDEILDIESQRGGVYKIKKRDEFESTIQELLNKNGGKKFENFEEIRNKYIYKNLYKIDGKSHYRLAELINEAIEEVN